VIILVKLPKKKRRREIILRLLFIGKLWAPLIAYRHLNEKIFRDGVPILVIRSCSKRYNAVVSWGRGRMVFPHIKSPWRKTMVYGYPPPPDRHMSGFEILSLIVRILKLIATVIDIMVTVMH